ncbi:calphotin [Drosophila tropicalis]|uniref:calphotin n=1 Tax=Drosophila tropicalis TaxID=46794 RepID=UPI0035AC04D1
MSRRGKVFLLVALLAMTMLPPSEGRPGRGRKRSFGLGLLGGALAGAAIGHAVGNAKNTPAPAPAPAVAPVATGTHVHHYYPAAAPVHAIAVAVPQPSPTVVETGAPDANGCYKQTIREQDPQNPKAYTETQHLVCPTIKQVNVAAPPISPSVNLVPVMPQPHPVAVPVPATAPVAPPVVVQAVHPTAAQPTASHPTPAPTQHAVAAAPAAPAVPLAPRYCRSCCCSSRTGGSRTSYSRSRSSSSCRARPTPSSDCFIQKNSLLSQKEVRSSNSSRLLYPSSGSLQLYNFPYLIYDKFNFKIQIT